MDGADRAVRDLDGVERGLQGAARGAAAAALSAASFAQNLGLAATAAVGLTSALAFGTAVQFDSLTRGLATVSTGAADLQGQLSRLQQVARLPGLSFEEAVRGSLALQTVGFSAQFAERALAAFGNATASAGGTSQDLGEALRQVQQIISAGRVTAENLNVIAERVPQVRTAMLQLYGTLSGEELQARGLSAQQVIEGLVGQLERLPSVSGGAANAIENFGDRLQQALRPLGQGLIEGLNAAGPAVDGFLGAVEARMRAVGEVLSAVGRSGVLRDSLAGFGALFGADVRSFQAVVVEVAATVLTIAANLPKAFQDAAAYARSLFDVLGSNIAETFRYAEQSTRSFISGITAVVQAVTTPLLDLVGLFAPMILVPLRGGLQSILEVLQTEVKNVFDPVTAPNYRALPAAPQIDLLDGRDERSRRIRDATRPLGLPEGLTFGGQAQGGTSPAAQQQQRTADRNADLLAAIERNTAQAAEALSLRRQALGGGALARLGVTPAELAAATGGTGRAPGESEYRAPISALEQNIRQIVRTQAAKSRFAPR